MVATPAPGSALRVEIDDVEPGAAAATRAVGAWSATGVLRTKDFADFTDAELERARVLLRDLPWTLSMRRTRRWQSAPRGRRRSAAAAAAEPDARRRPDRSAAAGAARSGRAPIVVIGDVSGSMERYSRMLLHFVYGLAHSATRVEAFLFATRLTRVTRPLIEQRGAAAFARVAREVQDWGGGTRIGEALRTFNLRWARRVIATVRSC